MCNIGTTIAGNTGNLYQWGRNTAFPAIGNIPTIRGPLTPAAAAASNAFITLGQT